MGLIRAHPIGFDLDRLITRMFNVYDTSHYKDFIHSNFSRR